MSSLNYKPDRLYKVLNLVDLSDCRPHIINASLKNILPNLLHKPRFHFINDLDDKTVSFQTILKLFSNKDTIVIIDVKHNYKYPMISYKMCTDISNYLLSNPDNLNIPLIILNYENTPDRCLYMCDYAITSHINVSYPVPDNCIEVIRNRGGSTGQMISLNL